MDQCHISICHRAVAWTTDVTHVSAVGLRGLKVQNEIWPVPNAVWHNYLILVQVGNNSGTSCQFGYISSFLKWLYLSKKLYQRRIFQDFASHYYLCQGGCVLPSVCLFIYSYITSTDEVMSYLAFVYLFACLSVSGSSWKFYQRCIFGQGSSLLNFGSHPDLNCLFISIFT